MKRSVLTLLAGLAAADPTAAQIAITSLNPNGLLTWTNFVTKAVYRAEWAPAAVGPWQPFPGLTNLSSVAATGTTVTVQVPLYGPAQFFRVVWTNAPFYAGLYDVQQYDANDVLQATFWLSLAGEPGSNDFVGTWTLYGLGTNSPDVWWTWPPNAPAASLLGYADTARNGISLNLSPNWSDNNADFRGFLAGDTFLGSWYWSGLRYGTGGTFTALKQHASKPAPAEPFGVWDYSASDFTTTGQLTFVTTSNPLQGQWVFGTSNPNWPTGHLLGQGQFANASVSGNTVSIDLETTNGVFSLRGEMAGNIYAGFAQWTGTNRSPKKVFSAVRRTAP
jgi:hypothetical protein